MNLWLIIHYFHYTTRLWMIEHSLFFVLFHSLKEFSLYACVSRMLRHWNSNSLKVFQSEHKWTITYFWIGINPLFALGKFKFIHSLMIVHMWWSCEIISLLTNLSVAFIRKAIIWNRRRWFLTPLNWTSQKQKRLNESSGNAFLEQSTTEIFFLIKSFYRSNTHDRSFPF